MLNKTSEIALRALILVAVEGKDKPLTPRMVADRLDTSPTYMAKITGLLVKGNILRSHRGAAGGVQLARTPASITILAVVEACQGLIVGNYCDGMGSHPEPVCAFHRAMLEAHQAIVGVLSRWTLADLVRHPGPAEFRATDCKMALFYDGEKLVCLAQANPGADAMPEPVVANGKSRR